MASKVDTRKEWEKEFDSEFPQLSVIEGQGDEGSIHGFDAIPYVKKFIQQTIDQEEATDRLQMQPEEEQ